MNKLNILFSLSSASVILVTIERFSFTTKVLFQPYSFLRLHELVQIIFIILLTVIIPFLIIKEITGNFESTKSGRAFLIFLMFIVGIYFYATGNGIHEVSSFNFNHYCDIKNISTDLCGGFFINDYYTGNILYFIGAALMVASTLLLERIKPNKGFKKGELVITFINASVYAIAIFAYAAFDKVAVGIIYSFLIMIIADLLFLQIWKNFNKYPVTLYTATTYTLGTIFALIARYI